MKDVLKRIFQLTLVGAALGFGCGLWLGPVLVRGEYAFAAGVAANPCIDPSMAAVDKAISYILMFGVAGALVIPIATWLVGRWWRKRKAKNAEPPAPPSPPAAAAKAA